RTRRARTRGPGRRRRAALARRRAGAARGRVRAAAALGYTCGAPCGRNLGALVAEVMRAVVVSTILLAACVAPERVGQPIEPGAWVEARGKIEDGRPIVVEVARQQRAADDKPEKVEILGPVTAATAETIDMLGVPLHTDADTEYEDSRRAKVEPFVPDRGEWLRVKARDKGDSIRAYSVRKSDSKGSFHVTGELRS